MHLSKVSKLLKKGQSSLPKSLNQNMTIRNYTIVVQARKKSVFTARERMRE